jgi:hypothetical protein
MIVPVLLASLITSKAIAVTSPNYQQVSVSSCWICEAISFLPSFNVGLSSPFGSVGAVEGSLNKGHVFLCGDPLVAGGTARLPEYFQAQRTLTKEADQLYYLHCRSKEWVSMENITSTIYGRSAFTFGRGRIIGFT